MTNKDQRKGNMISSFIQSYLTQKQYTSPLYSNMYDSFLRMSKLQTDLNKTSSEVRKLKKKKREKMEEKENSQISVQKVKYAYFKEYKRSKITPKLTDDNDAKKENSKSACFLKLLLQNVSGENSIRKKCENGVEEQRSVEKGKVFQDKRLQQDHFPSKKIKASTKKESALFQIKSMKFSDAGCESTEKSKRIHTKSKHGHFKSLPETNIKKDMFETLAKMSQKTAIQKTRMLQNRTQTETELEKRKQMVHSKSDKRKHIAQKPKLSAPKEKLQSNTCFTTLQMRDSQAGIEPWGNEDNVHREDLTYLWSPSS